MGKQTLWSLLIFIALFLVLAFIEWLAPQLQGQLLKWNDPAFIVGIPASIIGVAYVRTIKNPQNYMGFYLGILMSLLLACQFYLQKNYDLVFLYIAVFLPFLISSLVTWRRATFAPFAHEAPFKPAFLSTGKMVLTHVICALCNRCYNDYHSSHGCYDDIQFLLCQFLSYLQEERCMAVLGYL